VSEVVIVMCGAVARPVLSSTINVITEVLGADVRLSPNVVDTRPAFDAKRNQYNSPLLLKQVITAVSGGAYRVLGITEGDLYIPMLSFVFGQAQVGGPGALVSTARLRQEFYRLPADPELLSDRVQKEVLHELGHTMTLFHCPDSSCVMSLATGVRHVDEKGIGYCESCRAAIGVAQMESRR
jgi:archaemetzincin